MRDISHDECERENAPQSEVETKRTLAVSFDVTSIGSLEDEIGVKV